MQDQVALGALALTLLCQGRHRPRPWLAKLLGQEVDFLKIILHNGSHRPGDPPLCDPGYDGRGKLPRAASKPSAPARIGGDQIGSSN